MRLHAQNRLRLHAGPHKGNTSGTGAKEEGFLSKGIYLETRAIPSTCKVQIYFVKDRRRSFIRKALTL